MESDQIIDGPELIEPDAKAVADTGLAFRSYHYATILLGFAWQGSAYTICVDTGRTMTLIDRKFLKDLALGLPIKKGKGAYLCSRSWNREALNRRLPCNVHVHQRPCTRQGVGCAHSP